MHFSRVWVERRMRNPVKCLVTLATESDIIACLLLLLEIHTLNHKSRGMFPLGLGRRTEKLMKMFSWVAHKLSKQVLYFEDVLNNSNFLTDALESNTYLPQHLQHELVTLSISSAQQSTVKSRCHSVSWHR